MPFLNPSFKKNPPLPLNLPFPIAPFAPFNLNLLRRGYFSLTESTIYILQNPNLIISKSNAPKCWLIRIEQTRRGQLRPLNPLSRMLTENTPVAFPKSLNFLHSRITQIGKAFSLDFVETSKILERELGEFDPILITKAVVSSDPWTADADDYAVMVIHGGKIGFINLRDKIWRSIDDPGVCDDVYHKGKFYDVDRQGRTVVIGSDLESKTVSNPLFGHGGQSKHLITSCDGDLFLIDKNIGYKKVSFYPEEHTEYQADLRVFKLNEKKKRWARVDSLGDQVFFLGDDCSYAIRAQDFPGLKGGCIYFSQEFFRGEDEGLGEFCVDTGVYLMKVYKCRPLLDFQRHSPIFWPPPTWFD